MASSPTAELLDFAQLDRYPEPQGPWELIDAFLTTTGPILDELERALDTGDDAAFRLYRHTLAGAATTIGAKAMLQTCGALARQEDRELQRQGLRDLRERFAQTQTALREWQAQGSAAASGPGQQTAPGKTLLLVEDNVTVRGGLILDLQGYYPLIVAEDGAQALALVRDATVLDGAVVDLNLGFSDRPEPTGLDVIRRLKDRLPVLVLTVDASPEAAEAALKAGAWAYLLKPAPPAVLRANLDMMLAHFPSRPANDADNPLDLAIGLLMANHRLEEPEARRLLKTLAASQRRRAADLARDVIVNQTFHNQLARLAGQLTLPGDAPIS